MKRNAKNARTSTASTAMLAGVASLVEDCDIAEDHSGRGVPL